MLRVAVTIARSGEAVARIVDNHRAEDNLVTPVHVDVGNTEVVEAIAKPGRFAVVAVPAPALGQLMGRGIHVERTELMARVAAAPQEDGRVAPVEIGSAEVVLRGTMSRVVGSPDGGIVALAALKAGQRIGGRRPAVATVPAVWLARLTVHVEQILGSLLGVLVARGIVVHVAYLDGLARGGVDNHVVGTAHQGLGLTVLVPVVEDEVELLVGTGHEVGTHVNPPQPRAVHLIALVQVEVVLIGGREQVARVVAPFHHELHLSVAVNVGHRTVVQRVAIGHDTVASHHGLHGDVPVLVFPGLHLS